MEDFRFLEDNCTCIIIIIAFFLLFGGREGCGGGFNLDCLFNNFFGGCNNSSWVWIIVLVLVWMYFCKGSSCGFLRNDIQ